MRSWWMTSTVCSKENSNAHWGEGTASKSAWRTSEIIDIARRYKYTLLAMSHLCTLSSIFQGYRPCASVSIYSLLLMNDMGQIDPTVSVLTGWFTYINLFSELYWEEFTASKAIWENTISQWLPHIRFLPVRIYHRLPPSNYLPPVSSIDTPVEVCLKRINCYFPSKCVSRSWRQPLESTQTSTTSFCVEEWLVTYSWILNVDDLWECVLYVRYWTERLRWTTLASGSMTCCGTTSLN